MFKDAREMDKVKLNEYSPKLLALTLLMIGLVFLFAVGIALGVDMGSGRVRGGELLDALLGKGDVKSETWLMVARGSLVALVISVILLNIEQSSFLKARAAKANEQE